MPDPAGFEYTFDHLSEVVEGLLEAIGFTGPMGIYMQDYGGPVGNRIISRHPDWLAWQVIQNSNAYEVGFTAAWDAIRHALWVDPSAETEAALLPFLELDGVKLVYTHGHRDPEAISPDNWNMDVHFLERPNARRVQLDLFYDYRTNVALYPAWQSFLREHQPETLILWGQNDIFFTPEGGEAYLRDLPDAEIIRLDTGHFAVEDRLAEIAEAIVRFHAQRVAPATMLDSAAVGDHSRSRWRPTVRTTAAVASVNVGRVRTVSLRGEPVRTAIWKSPVAGPVAVRGVNLAGDTQADRSVHGGPDKAVYAYAAEDLAWWAAQLDRPVEPGTFGENLTTTGMDLAAATIGDRWAVGTTVLEISQPRIPCYKLGIRMDDPRFPVRFAQSARPGRTCGSWRRATSPPATRSGLVRRPVTASRLGSSSAPTTRTGRSSPAFSTHRSYRRAGSIGPTTCSTRGQLDAVLDVRRSGAWTAGSWPR